MEKKKIIFIDDDINMLSGLRRSLYSYSDVWDISYFNDPEEGMRAVLENKPDIVFLDYKMPKLDGLEIASQINQQLSGVKLVLLSGQSEEEVFHKAKEVVNHYIEKPCSQDTIIDIINSI